MAMSTPAHDSPRTHLTSDYIREKFLEATDEPLRLKKVRIEGDLDLRFRLIKRAIHMIDAEFSGEVDFRNARFASALLLEDCNFEKKVNAGDTNLSNCVCESDLSFQRSTFKAAAWFVGLECKSSGNFRDCKFEWCVPVTSLGNDLSHVDFNEATFTKELVMVRARFCGAVCFNGLKCGMSAFFHEARFEFVNTPVDFLGSSFGLVCDVSRAVFHSGAAFESVKPDLRLDLRYCQFLHPEALVNLSYVSTIQLTLTGAVFKGPVSISGIRCRGEARLDAQILYENVEDVQEKLPVGKLSDELRSAFRDVNFPLGDSATVENKDDQWFLQASKNPVVPPYQLLVVPQPTEHPHHPSEKKKSQIVIPAIFRGNVSFESAAIEGNLFLSGGTFDGGLNLTNASMHALNVGNGDAFAGGEKSRFLNCQFAIFDTSGDLTIWKKLAASQDPSHFTRDHYQALEAYYRVKGMRSLADEIYYAGRRKDHLVKAKERRKTNTGWATRLGPHDVLEFMSWALTGYGVKLRRLGYGIAFFLIVGTAMFSWDGALAPAKPVTPAQHTPAAPTIPTPLLTKVSHGFGYSLGSLLPLVDLHLSKDWEPVGDWRRAYLALHIGAGWIFFPLLLAGITAQLNKN